MFTPLDPNKRTRRRALKTQIDVRRALAFIFGELEADRMNAIKARVMIYALQTFSAVHDRSELEAELEAIKKTLADVGHEVRR